MEKDGRCGMCAEKLLEQNRELWSDAVRRLGDSKNPDWCQVCDQLFMQGDNALTLFNDIEITHQEEEGTE